MANEFIPRLNDNGIRGNRLWFSNENPFYESGWGMPNCTCYAWGRAWESGGGTPETRPNFAPRDAELWWDWPDGYERGQTPRLGAILCLADGPHSGWGHVAIVEEINPDGSIVTSESAYNGYFWELHTRRRENNYIDDFGQPPYVFQGFIYYPYSGGSPGGGGIEPKKLFLLSGLKKRLRQWEYRRITNL